MTTRFGWRARSASALPIAGSVDVLVVGLVHDHRHVGRDRRAGRPRARPGRTRSRWDCWDWRDRPGGCADRPPRRSPQDRGRAAARWSGWQGRHAPRRRADCGGRDREHGEAELAVDHLVAGRGEALREQHQQLVRAVAEADLAGFDAQLRGQRATQAQSLRVRIAVDLLRGQRAQRLQHARTGAVGILVRAQLDQRRAVAQRAATGRSWPGS